MADVAFVDTSPLILLTRVDQLSLLELAAKRVVVPGAVLTEFMEKESDSRATVGLLHACGIEVVADPVLSKAVASWDLGTGNPPSSVCRLAHPDPWPSSTIDKLAVAPPRSGSRRSARSVSSCGRAGLAESIEPVR